MNALEKLKKIKEYKGLLIKYKQSTSPLEQIKFARQAKGLAKILGLGDKLLENGEITNILTKAKADLSLPPLEFQAKHGDKLLEIAESLDKSLDVEVKNLADEVIHAHKQNMIQLAENNNIDASLDGISTKQRKHLPQIEIGAFLEDLTKNGVEVLEDYAQTDELSPTQHEFNQQKIDNIINSSKLNLPIIISSDNIIVDGHHRWKARQRVDGTVAILRVAMTYEKLSSFVSNKPYVNYEKL